MRSNIFDRLSFLSLFLVIVLLPLFCLPFSNIPVETSKGLLLVLGLVLSVVFWAIARFIDGKIIFPKSWLLVSGLGVLFTFLLSSLVSKSSGVSMFGTMFDVGSFWFIFTAFILMLMCSILFRTSKQAKVVLHGAIVSSAVVLIFQTIHLFAPTYTSLGGILTGKTGNIFGSWNAFGLFAGFSALMFLLRTEFFPVSKRDKIVFPILILISVFLAAAVNFSLVWILLGIFSLIIFVYKVSVTFHTSREGEEQIHKKNFPMTSFVVMIISLLFFISGPFVGNFIPNHLNITNTEVGPSLQATLSITKAVLVKHPVFGIGPNKFAQAWAMYKPLSINNTQFWNVSFDSGSGLLPTLATTVGGLGMLALIIFLILFLVVGLRSLFSSVKDGVNWEIMAFFVMSLYLFIAAFFYSTGMVIFLLSLVFAGVLLGLVYSNSKKEVFISFLEDHRKSFFAILVLIFVVILSVSVAFKYVERFASVSYFRKTLSASTEPVAEDSINKALALYENDLYYRTDAQVYIVKLNSLANEGSSLSDADKANLQTAFDQAVNSAQLATVYDPNNYLNFQLLGSVYQSVGAIGVKNAYDNAIAAYLTASSLNPLNPGVKIELADASFLDGRVQDAKDYANQALTLGGDDVDAFVLLSQIAKSQGDITSAQNYANQALALSPNDQSLIQYANSLNTAPAPVSTSSKTKS